MIKTFDQFINRRIDEASSTDEVEKLKKLWENIKSFWKSVEYDDIKPLAEFLMDKFKELVGNVEYTWEWEDFIAKEKRLRVHITMYGFNSLFFFTRKDAEQAWDNFQAMQSEKLHSQQAFEESLSIVIEHYRKIKI